MVARQAVADGAAVGESRGRGGVGGAGQEVGAARAKGHGRRGGLEGCRAGVEAAVLCWLALDDVLRRQQQQNRFMQSQGLESVAGCLCLAVCVQKKASPSVPLWIRKLVRTA